MPRISRIKSSTKIYHVMLRGIDKRNIFLTEDDRLSFLKYIEKAKTKSNFLVLSYCLMTNHVHLLIQEGDEELGDIIRRITVGYVQYHNINNGRYGHLFQNRYKSEPVNDERYLLVVMRYIHQNPVKAGIVNTLSEYKWSSYEEFLEKHKKKNITDTKVLMKYFNSAKDFVQFNNQIVEEHCMEYNPNVRYKDDELKAIINNIIKVDTLLSLDIQSRNEALLRIKNKTGASIRQLERVLPFGRGILQNINN